MKTNKAVSMISLILTIVIIIILAAITAPLLSDVMTDSTKLDAREELANVSLVVQNAKKEIMTDRFNPNPDYIISYEDLVYKFGGVLSSGEIKHIKDTNEDTTLGAPHKYYLMNQERFDDELGSDFNIDRMRDAREYLVNYMDELVVLNYDGKKMAEGSIIELNPLIRGEVEITFTPNGNVEWKKQQSASVDLSYIVGSASIHSAKYLWSESVSAPSSDAFNDTTYGGVLSTTERTEGIELVGETGNGWYLWVEVVYDDDGITKTKYEKSNAFFVDNTEPTFELEVN